ncbi:MAG: sugar nucleotidyltransferase, partial [Ignavibacteria bacterium]
MKAIIPVAGIGTRLRPLTNTTPKVLINVAGKPMLSYLIDDLIESGKIDTIILIVGYLGDKIKDYISKTYSSLPNMKFEFASQTEMLGLGHAVYQAKPFVGNEPVLMFLGDTIFEFSLDGVLSSKYSMIGIKKVEDITRYGIAEIENGFIKRMIEKPSGPEITRSKSAIAGVYYLRDASKLFSSIEYVINKNIRTKNEYQLTDALQNMVDEGEKFATFKIDNWFDCGKPETLLDTNRYILERDYSSSKFNSEDSKLIPPVFIGNDCTVEYSEIGPYTTVASGAKVI